MDGHETAAVTPNMLLHWRRYHNMQPTAFVTKRIGTYPSWNLEMRRFASLQENLNNVDRIVHWKLTLSRSYGADAARHQDGGSCKYAKDNIRTQKERLTSRFIRSVMRAAAAGSHHWVVYCARSHDERRYFSVESSSRKTYRTYLK
jgi:hypothetical protein